MSAASDKISKVKQWRINRKFQRVIPEYDIFTRYQAGDIEEQCFANINTDWKLHVSVHPEDYNKAWRTISPILHEFAHKFKRTIPARVNDRIEKLKNPNNTKDGLEDIVNDIITEAKIRRQKIEVELLGLVEVIDFLQDEADELGSEFSAEDKRELQAYLDEKILLQQELASLQLPDDEKNLKSIQRFSQGMQFTIYLPSGKQRKKYQALSQLIEMVLRENSIRPGVIDNSDKALGEYVSTRHSGKNCYKSAMDVDSYNPDNVEEFFAEIEKKPSSEIFKALRKAETTYLSLKKQNATTFLFFSKVQNDNSLKQSQVKHALNLK